jgi:hypothetical protein
MGTLWVTTQWKNFSLHNCKLWYHMNFISWDKPTLYSYLTNIRNAGHVVPVLNGKHATPKWDIESLKYKYKAHSVSYVILQSPTGREFHQIFHQRHHYNENTCMQISAFPFYWKAISNIYTHHTISLSWKWKKSLEWDIKNSCEVDSLSTP